METPLKNKVSERLAVGFPATTKIATVSKKQLTVDYAELGTLTQIANKYEVAKNTVVYYFKKLDIPYKTKVRNYGVNSSFFESDSEESFYWAGFIAADGCISIRKKFDNRNLILQLGEKDLDHLVRFKKTIASNHPLKKRVVENSKRNPNWTDRVLYKITIGSHRMVNSLVRFGIVPRKTKTYNLPAWLVHHPMVHHFMRGYFDGDGCINTVVRPNHRNQYRLSITGNLNFLNTYGSILCEQLEMPNKALKPNGSIYVLSYGGNLLTSKIGSFLYKEASVYLERKYKLWRECCEYYN